MSMPPKQSEKKIAADKKVEFQNLRSRMEALYANPTVAPATPGNDLLGALPSTENVLNQLIGGATLTRRSEPLKLSTNPLTQLMGGVVPTPSNPKAAHGKNRAQQRAKTNLMIRRSAKAMLGPSAYTKSRSTSELMKQSQQHLQVDDAMKIGVRGLSAFTLKDPTIIQAQELIGNINNGKTRWEEKQQAALVYMLNIFIARLQYNDTLYQYYQTLPEPELQQHLKTRLGGIEITLAETQFIKDTYTSPELIAGDLNIYLDLIQLILKYIDSEDLFDHIHQSTAKDARYMESQETSSLPSIQSELQLAHRTMANPDKIIKLELARAMLQSPEYLAGQEFPHLKATAQLAKAFCTAQYSTFIRYYTFASIMTGNGPDAQFILVSVPGKEYFSDLAKDLSDIKDELVTLETVDPAAFVQAQEKITQLNKQIIIKNSAFFVKKTFDTTYGVFKDLQKILKTIRAKKKARDRVAPSPSAPAAAVSLPSVTEPPTLEDNKDDAETIELVERINAFDATERKELEQPFVVPSFSKIPDHVKKFILDALKKYNDEEDNPDVKTTAEVESSTFGNQHVKLLLRVLYFDKPEVLTHVFKKTASTQLTLFDLRHLVKALGGTIEDDKAGCRFRVIIDGCCGDIFGIPLGLPALHAPHGPKDSRNGIATNLTVQLFSELFKRAGVFTLYKNAIDSYLLRKKVPLELLRTARPIKPPTMPAPEAPVTIRAPAKAKPR
jgi:hypothetical protein